MQSKAANPVEKGTPIFLFYAHYKTSPYLNEKKLALLNMASKPIDIGRTESLTFFRIYLQSY